MGKKMTKDTNARKKLKKNNKLIAELNVDVVRYQAFLDDINPETLTNDFLDDFRLEFLKTASFLPFQLKFFLRILPTTFYNPDSPIMFQDFIDRWGTHVVKSANFGGRLQFIKTATDNGDVDISEFHQETQKTFEKLSANSYMKQTQDESSTDVSVAASASGSAGGPSGFGFLYHKDPHNLYM